MKPTHLISFSVVLLCSTLFFLKCSKESINHYSFDSVFNATRIDQIDSMIQFNICDYIKSDWDSILIVKPYTDVSKQILLKKLKNFSEVKSKIKDIEFGDQVCYLILVKEKIIIGYGEVSRNHIDFATFPDTDNSTMGILKRESCDRLFFKNRHLIIETGYN